MSGSFQVVPPVSHTVDDGEHFPVGNVVVALCGGAFAGEEGDGVPGGVM